MESLKKYDGMSDNAKLYCLATMPELAEYHLDNFIIGKCYKDSTAENIRYRIQVFIKFLRNIDIGVADASKVMLKFRRLLDKDAGIKSSTKNNNLWSAIEFVRYLQKQKHLSRDIEIDVKWFNVANNNSRQPLRENEMQKITDFLSSLPQTPQNARLKAMFALLIHQGLRLSEALNLDFEDIDLKNNVAYVLRKGYDQKQLIELSFEVVDKLREHIKLSGITAGAIFISQSRAVKGSKRLTTRGFSKVITSTLAKLDIDNSSMGFRHYFATALIKSNMPLPDVMHEMNHKNLGSTQRYYDAYDAKRVGRVRERVFSDVSF